MTRRRIPYRVCSCMPNGVVTHLEARLLKELVNREIHPIRCAESCKRKYQKGMRIGDLCAETGHFRWAMKVWRLTERLIESKDWDDWLYVSFNTEWMRLSDVVSEAECELLSRRRSDLWRALGHPEAAWWDKHREHISSMTSGSFYDFMWIEKYDYDPTQFLEEIEEDLKEQEAMAKTEAIFNEGQCDYRPACSQNFSEYWGDTPIPEDYSFGK